VYQVTERCGGGRSAWPCTLKRLGLRHRSRDGARRLRVPERRGAHRLRPHARAAGRLCARARPMQVSVHRIG